MHTQKFKVLMSCAALAVACALAMACGTTTSSSVGNGTGMATVSISDPATCSGPGGPFEHVYVTITDVQASMSTAAGDNGSGWVDLTPNLASNPKQVDLLGQANNTCFLATLGDPQELQAGSYQQIRLILASNSASLPHNACASVGSTNCVVLSANGSVHPLLLSSESKTGLKIPSGQIAGGAFNIARGKTQDLDINFSTCASIIREGNGRYRLKPVLHAGEISATDTSINGTVVDGATGKPVNGAVEVALEQKDATGVDRIMMSTMADASGNFVFCPVPAGTYDVVVVGVTTGGAAYAPSVLTGVTNGETTGTLDLYPSTVGNQGAVTVNGTVTSQNSANAGTITDVNLSALEQGPANGGIFTIPLLPTAQQTSATLALETAAPTSSVTCPTGTYCADYMMVLPSAAMNVGTYSSAGGGIAHAVALASYKVDGLAFVPSSGGTADCSPSEVMTPVIAIASAGPFTIAVGNAPAFVKCQ